MRKALEVSFWNEWDEPSWGCDHMNLVTSVTWSLHGVSRQAMSCSVSYDYVVLGNRVGVIDQIFFRPEPLRIIIGTYDEQYGLVVTRPPPTRPRPVEADERVIGLAATFAGGEHAGAGRAGVTRTRLRGIGNS